MLSEQRRGEPDREPKAVNEDLALYYVFSAESDLLIGCHIPGHWEHGMVATIDVEP